MDNDLRHPSSADLMLLAPCRILYMLLLPCVCLKLCRNSHTAVFTIDFAYTLQMHASVVFNLYFPPTLLNPLPPVFLLHEGRSALCILHEACEF